MDLLTAKIIAIVSSIVVALIVMVFLIVYKYLRTKHAKQSRAKFNKKSREKMIRNRPTPLKLDEVRYQRLPSQCTPLVITPTTPSQFTIPQSRQHQDDGIAPSPDHNKPWFSSRLGKSPVLLQHSPKLLRAMSEGYSPTTLKPGRIPPHGKIECFLKYQDNSLSVQVTN